MDPVTIKGFVVGMNNRQPDYALPEGTLRNAVNTDIDNRGFLSRRDGYEKIHAGTNTHSGFSCDLWTLFVKNGQLHKLNDDDSSTILMPVAGDVCYFFWNGVVYFSDNVKAYKLLSDGTITLWGVVPLDAPVLSVTSGNLSKGTYIAAITPISADEVEHGASELVTIDVLDNSGITFNLPITSDPQVAHIRIYLSSVNGQVLYAIRDVAVGTTSTTVTAIDDGVELETVGVTNMPAGTDIDIYKGRLYIKAGKNLWYTEPHAFDRIKPSTNFLSFPVNISVFGAVNNGIWIVADKTRFYSGDDPQKFKVDQAADYGAPVGHSVKVPNTNDIVWYSNRGIIRAGDGFINLQEENVAVESGDKSAIFVKEHDGLRQVVASVMNSKVSPMAATSYLEMEVIRKA